MFKGLLKIGEPSPSLPLTRYKSLIVSDRGMRIIYLPPYSPDYNPIEPAFGCFKAWIRSNDDTVREAMETEDDDEGEDGGAAMLTLAVTESCTPAKALEWFRMCGYY